MFSIKQPQYKQILYACKKKQTNKMFEIDDVEIRDILGVPEYWLQIGIRRCSCGLINQLQESFNVMSFLLK